MRRMVQQAKRNLSLESDGSTDPEFQGLLGWVLSLRRSKRADREARQNQLRLIQRLSLNGRGQVLLIECAGERFLLGGGLDSVHTIVRLRGAGLSTAESENEVAPCQ